MSKKTSFPFFFYFLIQILDSNDVFWVYFRMIVIYRIPFESLKNFIHPFPLSICNLFLQFCSLKYQFCLTGFLVDFKLEFYRLKQAEKFSSNWEKIRLIKLDISNGRISKVIQKNNKNSEEDCRWLNLLAGQNPSSFISGLGADMSIC